MVVAPHPDTERLCSRVAALARRHPGPPPTAVMPALSCCEDGWVETDDEMFMRCPNGCESPLPRMRLAE